MELLGFLLSVPVLQAILTAVVIALTLGFYLHATKSERTFPGPTRYPILGNTVVTLKNYHRTTQWITECLREADSTYILLAFPGARCLVLTDPRDVEHILKTNFNNYPKGEEFYGMFKELLGGGIFNADGEAWRLQRKVASHEFSTKSLKELMLGTFTRKVNGAMLPLMEEMAESGAQFDLQEIFQRSSFDTICAIAFGEDPGCLSPGLPIVPFAAAFDVAQEAHSMRFQVPPIFTRVQKWLGIGWERRLKEAIVGVDDFAYGVIRKRRQEMAGLSASTREDLLSRFIAVADREASPAASDGGDAAAPSASDRYLRDIILNFVLAGRDTSAVTLTWFIWAMTQHRDVEQKIVEEVERITAQKAAGSSGSFDFEDVRQMTYLHAALSESLRLYPAVPSDVKSALADDTLPSGAYVRAGWRVAYHPYAQGRDPRVWGSEVLEFKPERWIDAEGRFIQHSPFKYPSFQAGPRICLGKEMAYLQMKVVVASLLRDFRFSVVPGYVVESKPTVVFAMRYGLKVTVEKRKRRVKG